MGAGCGSSDKGARSPWSAVIDQELKNKSREERFNLKMLILGTTASGKSTVCKQLKIIHSEGFTDEERLNYKNILLVNLFLGMKELVIQAEKLNFKVARKNKKAAKFFLEINPLSCPDFTTELALQTKSLAQDPGILKTYEKRGSEYELPSYSEYCIQHLDRLVQSNFIPTNDDVLHARQRTTGIAETSFQLNKYRWTIIDVGGQRTERRKWLHCFDGVNALIYVAALDEYNMMNAEDPSVSRMEESLKVFQEILNQPNFEDTCALLFLNKTDLFREKIKQVEISKTYPEYTGGQDYAQAVTFIKNKYLQRITHPKRRASEIYVHETCAIDTESISIIFEAVMDTIFRERLKISGL